MKKILLSTIMIAFVGALVSVGATGAFLSDSEVTRGNVFEAGAIDLRVDNESYYNGAISTSTTWLDPQNLSEGLLFLNFLDLKPDDEGEDTISLHVGTNPAWACMELSLVSDDDISSNEPELGAGDALENPTDTLDGELGGLVEMIWWTDDGDNVLEVGEEIFTDDGLPAPILDLFGNATSTLKFTLADSGSNLWGGNGPLSATEVHYIGKAWCFGDMTLNPLTQDGGDQGRSPIDPAGPGWSCDGKQIDNKSQTDGLTMDITFTAIQARHNDDFLCEPQPTGTITIQKIVEGADPESFGPFKIDGNTVPLNTPIAVQPGLHTITETGSGDYNATFGLDCNASGEVTVVAGEEYTCTITNTLGSGTLIVEKVISGGPLAGSPESFSFSVNGGGATPFENDGSNSIALAPGAYDVTETVSPDYVTTYANSVNGSANCTDLPVANGGSVTCTITNTLGSGTLFVKKVLINDDGGLTATTTFSFGVNGMATTTFEADGQNDVAVAPGTYSVVEEVHPDYTTTYENCSAVAVGNGETETCTITNDDNEPTLSCNADLDAMLVLDRSGSIDSGELSTLKTAAHAFVGALAPSAAGVHVGQSSFSSTGTLDLHLTDDEAAAHLAINALAAGGSTDLEAGITVAIGELDNAHTHERPATPDAIVVITDGAPNVPSSPAGQAALDAAAAADAARAAGIEVFVVGVGVTLDTETFLKTDIADDEAHYFAAADFDELQTVLQGLVACDDMRKVYNFVGVTTANDGTGGNPLALEHDSDLWPWTAVGDQNDANSPTDSEYTAISTDNNSRWTSDDPSTGDFMVKRFHFTLTEPLATISDIKALWKGQPEATANTTIWVLKTGLDEFTAANWVQLGSSLSIPAGSDRYMVRHIADADVETYVSGGGVIDVMVAIDVTSEDLRTDYMELVVTSTP